MSLQRKQELFLDALEESFKFIRLTYARVLGTLESYRYPSEETPDALILDAWVIVDLAKRIRNLLNNTPGLKQNATLKGFLDDTSVVPDFRHYIQHLEEKATGVAPTGHPIWGSVSWAKVLSEKHLQSCMYAPGRLAKCKGIPVVNPVGRTFHGTLDHVELAVGSSVVNLSDLVRRIDKFGEAFSASVAAAEKSGQRDSRGLIRFVVEPGD